MNSAEDFVIDASGVTARHGGELILDSIDFKVSPSTVFLLIGDDLSGRSALLRAMLGIERIDGGTVRLFGRRNRDFADGRSHSVYINSTMHGVARRLSVSQLMRYHATYARAWDKDLAFELARKFALNDTQSVIEMSASRQSLTLILTALAQRPSLILWDTPQPALDETTRAVAASAVLEYVRASSATLVHAVPVVYPELEDAVDQVGFIQHGRMRMCETSQSICDAFRWYHLLRGAADEARAKVTLPIALEHHTGRETWWLIRGDEASTLDQLQSSGAAVANISPVALGDAVQAYKGMMGMTK